MSHFFCVRCFENPKQAIVGDCPECAVHSKGVNTNGKKFTREQINKLFEKIWFDPANPITEYTEYFGIRLKWLTLMYAAGWTEAEFENETIQILPGRKLTDYRSENRRTRKHA